MHIKILAVATLTVMWTGHALADCAADLDKMKDAVTSAETGAASTASGMPETKHQKEVLSGEKTDNSKTDKAGAASAEVQAATPHQKEVMGHKQEASNDPAQIMKDATDMANKGDEKGCMEKANQLKSMLGQD